MTPPIDGWVLAVLGGGVPELGPAELSRTFGEARRFVSHRVVEYHE